jgi:hypothetical protein
VAGDRVAEYEEIVGYHLEQAHRYAIELGPAGDRSRTLGEKASSLLAKSGRAALDRSDVPAAVSLLSRALALVSPDTPARPRLLVDLCLALELSGHYDDEAVRLEEAATLARAAGDPRVESLVAIRKTALSIHLATSPFETLLGELRSMLPDLEEAGEHRALGRRGRTSASSCSGWVARRRLSKRSSGPCITPEPRETGAARWLGSGS